MPDTEPIPEAAATAAGEEGRSGSGLGHVFAHGSRGQLQWEYLPPRAHPIVYAGLIVFGFVFVTGTIENLLRGFRPGLLLVYAIPLAATAAVLVALWPSTVRIHAAGVAPSRPLVLRWWRPFLPWRDAAAVYPAYYDVTGAFVSPFASSDGKVTQMGLRIEMQDGHSETLRFTPTRFASGQAQSAGFQEAVQLVRSAFAAMGRPTAPAGERFTEEQTRTMIAEATKPFLPFLVIVALFASAAPVLFVLTRLDVPVPVALLAALALPLGTSLHSYRMSRRRNAILNRLSRAVEAQA